MYQPTMQDVTYQDCPIQYFTSLSTGIKEIDISDMRDSIVSKWVREPPKKPFYHNLNKLIKIDISSIMPRFEVKRETSSIEEVGEDVARVISEEEIALEMVKRDFVVKMPPKKRYKIHVVVRNVKKGRPRLVDPDEFLF